MNRAKIFVVFTFLLAFAVCVSAQSVQFPNELKGYEFFGKGKLANLKLGVSIKEDVKNVFGVPRQEIYNSAVYDYDPNWSIQFVYFDEQKSMITHCLASDTSKIIKKLVPLPQFIGMIS